MPGFLVPVPSMLWFRVVPILLLIVLNTLVHALPLLAVAVFKAVLPSERARRACNPLLLWFAASITTGQIDWLTTGVLQRSVGYSLFGAFNPFLLHY